MISDKDAWRATVLAWRKRYPLIVHENTTFTVGAGWREIVEDALAALESIATAQKAAGEVPVTVLEVHQKYGSLRVDTTRETPAIATIVEASEARSLRTCEFCAQPAVLRFEGEWMLTLCSVCHLARGH